MAKYSIKNTTLTAIADAIREKKNISNKMLPEDMPDLIRAITFTLQSKTVSPSTSSQTVKPDTGYDGLSQVKVNAMATATQATPSISVSSTGLITASATQSAGYVASGTKSTTKQLTAQAAQTITPGTSNKTISSGRYLTGTQTIKGDANLLPANIKSGVQIFGVSGTYAGTDGSGSGGGLPSGVTAMNYGTFVLTSDTNTNSVTHGLGVRPDFAIWWLDGTHSVESGGALRGSLIHSGVDTESFNLSYTAAGYKSDGTFDITQGDIQGMYYANTSGFSCFCSSNTPMKAGYTYHWIAGVLNNKA